MRKFWRYGRGGLDFDSLKGWGGMIEVVFEKTEEWKEEMGWTATNTSIREGRAYV